MRRSVLLVCACTIALLEVARAQSPAPPARAGAPPAAAATAPSTKLPVRRVVLYKSGVGYFEHVGRVRGSQSVVIDFNTAQLNDVLQSLTALDLGDGRIADVSYNSEAPFAQRLGALALPLGERATLSELLGTLRGARLEVRTGDRTISGRLLGIERRPRKDDAPRDELTVVTDAGEMRSVELGPAVSVKLAEREPAEQVGAYLGLLASNRSQDHRRLTIATVGTGPRDVLVSYISEVPVWKTTYRLVLPTTGAAVLQGWAVVDNTIGEDWNDVELSLVAGAPQSFIQPLSQPLYTRRPVIPITGVNLPTPQLHQETLSDNGRERPGAIAGRVVDGDGGPVAGAIVTAVDRASSVRRALVVADSQGRYAFNGLPPGSYRLEFSLAGFNATVIDGVQADGISRAMQDTVMRVSSVAEAVTVNGASSRIDLSRSASRGVVGGVTGGIVGGLASAPPPPPAAPAPIGRGVVEDRLAGMQASAQGQSLGDLFEYKVTGAVTIHKNQSALVPILRAEVGVERVSLWNERSGGGRPLRSVWLTNSSGLTLDSGSFTVLEGSTFAGEGLLDPIKPNEKRLLSFAVDLGVQVEARRGDDPQRVSRITIARGVAIQHSEQVSHRVYTVRNNDITARTVVIEHPARQGWTLAAGVTPAETALGIYRFAVPLQPKSTATLDVEEHHPVDATFSISQLNDDQVTVFARGARDNPRLLQALGPIQAKKKEIASIAADLDARQTEANKIAADQQRLRDNMRALKGSAGEQQLLKRYVAELGQQEDRIAALRRETADLEQKQSRAQSELTALIDALALDLEVSDTGQI